MDPGLTLAQCKQLARAVLLSSEVVRLLDSDSDAATAKANEALRSQRQIETVYREALAALGGVEDVREVSSPAASATVASPAAGSSWSRYEP